MQVPKQDRVSWGTSQTSCDQKRWLIPIYSFSWLNATRYDMTDSDYYLHDSSTWLMNSWLTLSDLIQPIPLYIKLLWSKGIALSSSSCWIQVVLEASHWTRAVCSRNPQRNVGFRKAATRTQLPLTTWCTKSLRTLNSWYGSSRDSTQDPWDPWTAQHSKWHHSLLVTLRQAYQNHDLNPRLETCNIWDCLPNSRRTQHSPMPISHWGTKQG